MVGITHYRRRTGVRQLMPFVLFFVSVASLVGVVAAQNANPVDCSAPSQVVTDRTEDDFVLMERVYPSLVKVGQVFSVTLKATAKEELAGFLLIEMLPPQIKLLAGDLKGFWLRPKPGDTLSLTYAARALTAGRVYWQGIERHVRLDGKNMQLSLTSGLTAYAECALLAELENRNFTTGDASVYAPGDTIEYTVTLTNFSTTATLNDNAGPEFTIKITDLLLSPLPAARASSGIVHYDRRTRTYRWDGTIPPQSTVVLTFRTKIFYGLRSDFAGTQRRVCTQGTAYADFDQDGIDQDGIHEIRVLTTDPTPLLVWLETQTCLGVSIRLGKVNPLVESEARASVHYSKKTEVFTLAGRKLFDSGWTKNAVEWKSPSANGVYIALVTTRTHDGTVVRSEIRKLVIAK